MTAFCVVTPSRGLVHSRTVEAVMANVGEAQLAGHVFTGWQLTHDLPIPDAHERVAEAGLATGADAIWFVEEDVIPPTGALLALLAMPGLVALVDYPVGESPIVNCAYHFRGEVHWCGLGCTLIRRAAFEQLARPWFRSDITFRLHGGTITEMLPGTPKPYGGQDIWFCWQARQAGMTLNEVIGLHARHAKLRALGAAQTNAGQHVIDILDDSRVEHWV